MRVRATTGVVLLCMLFAFAGPAEADVQLSSESAPSPAGISAPPPCDPTPCDGVIQENYRVAQKAYAACIAIDANRWCEMEKMDRGFAAGEYFKRFKVSPENDPKLRAKPNLKEETGRHAGDQKVEKDLIEGSKRVSPPPSLPARINEKLGGKESIGN